MASGSVIIDVDMPYLQTPWCTIAYPVEHTVNVEATNSFLEKCQEIDNLITNHCSTVFNFCPQEITDMYRGILKAYETKTVFRTSLNTTTVIFEDEEEHPKSNAKDVLKVGDRVRFIFKIKKISMLNHELKLQIDVLQLEKSIC